MRRAETPHPTSSTRAAQASLRRRLQARLAAERGFTLVELVVATALALVVFSAAMALLTHSMNAQALQQSRTTQLEEAQVAMQRVIRELRQSSSVTVSSATSISYSIPVSGTTQAVTLSCSGSSCTRTANGTTTTVITDLANTDVFTGSPNGTAPTYVGVKLVISTAKHTTVTLSDGVGLRNVVLGS
jgi:prepilin-type N-terminal cleavage/methylation domain-containing protein